MKLININDYVFLHFTLDDRKLIINEDGIFIDEFGNAVDDAGIVKFMRDFAKRAPEDYRAWLLKNHPQPTNNVSRTIN